MNSAKEPELFPDEQPDDVGVDPTEIAALRQSLAEQRTTLHYAIGLAILLALAVNVFLYYQSRAMRTQQYVLQQNVAELSKVVADYESNSVPWLERFAIDLHRLAARDPEISRLVAKYQLPQPTNAPSPLPAPTNR
jgi:hypothetical protein